jgi:hypothetical protein
MARPVYPDPGILAAAATPTERQAHATALVCFRGFSTAAAKLRKLALGSIGDTNLDTIRDANLRLHHAIANSIIVSMDALHGTFTEADINAFLEALNAKLKSVTAFGDHNATFNKTLAKLLRAGSPVGPFAAYRPYRYVATLPGFPTFEKHVDNYVTTTPVATTPDHRAEVEVRPLLRCCRQSSRLLRCCRCRYPSRHWPHAQPVAGCPLRDAEEIPR